LDPAEEVHQLLRLDGELGKQVVLLGRQAKLEAVFTISATSN
jgi:hypothetical protein